jgi:5-carboxymethyl-2-hydroxymuconate isomerase
MPHCIIEYPVNLEKETNFKKVVLQINQAIVNSDLFDNTTIKTRAIPIANYLIGGLQKPFIHITVKLLQGRTKDQKQTLAKELLKTTSKIFKIIDDVSVEIIELNPDYYFKKI